jgi:hypothetical protein
LSFAQFAPGLPQRTLTVTPTQAINFGTFCLTGGSGGTISVDWNNIVTTTGGIVNLAIGQAPQPAIYAIKLCQGRRVRIAFKPTFLSCNGVSLKLESGPSEYGTNSEIFTTNKDCDFVNSVRVGGTLTIPGNTPPGIYVGEIEIVLNQE